MDNAYADNLISWRVRHFFNVASQGIASQIKGFQVSDHTMQKIPNLARTANTHELPAHVETTRVKLRCAGLVRAWVTGWLNLVLLVLINKCHTVAGIL